MINLPSLLAFLALLAIPAFGQNGRALSTPTALDKYIASPDASYKYELIKTIPGKDYTAYVLEMTSQTWRSNNEVDRNLWKHWMTIIKPDQVTTTNSFVYITGGSNKDAAPSSVSDRIAQIALATQSVVTELRMVPNQPLTFTDDKKRRYEDAYVAYTWDKYLRTGNESWPARLPMTKAVVRAMDTIIFFCGSEAGGKLEINSFVVAGASKRGWTAWTTAAVDKRVVAVIPMVIDLLNIIPSFKHHFEVYGYYAPAVRDYEAMGIMNWEDSPQYRALTKIVDPYEYRNRMTMPKFIINAGGDQFFLPDSWQFYYDDLPGVKYLRYVPNAGHSLRGSDAWKTVLAFYRSIITKNALPQFTWKVEKDGTIRVQAKDKPTAVKLWQITNPTARDFRLTSIGPKWRSSPLAKQGDGTYTARLVPPRKGWTAYMVEMTFSSGLQAAPFKFTTGVKVVPEVKPAGGERYQGTEVQ